MAGRPAIVIAGMLALLDAATAAAQMPFPREPEEDNKEYILDAVSNDYSRPWREMWDEGDNGFRMRVGSNNVTQWFLEEELKFATSLIENRLRFRFHHARFLRYSTEELTDDTFEFEGRLFDDICLSAYATPTSKRVENTIGLALQNRRAVNRYLLFFVEFPHVVRNFTEDHKDNSDSLSTVFTDKPIRLGVNIREMLGPRVWVRLEGEIIPQFTVVEEQQATGMRVRTETVSAESLAGWLEYNWPEEDPLPARSAVGIEAGYHEDERREPLDFPVTLSAGTASPREAHDHRSLSGDVFMEFDKDLYWISANDSVSAWTDTRSFGQPYAWVVLNDRWTLRAAVRFEKREIRWSNDQGVKSSIENHYVAPMAGARLALGSHRRSVVEMGWASLARRREERTGARASVEADFDHHRLYAAFEYVFGARSVVRLVESFELDAADRGQYGIHDHAFFQMIFGF